MVVLRPDEVLREHESLSMATKTMFCEREKVDVLNNNKCRIRNFYVVPGYGQTLLGMPDIKLLNIFNISCNTKEDKDEICNTNIHSTHDAASKQCCANTGPERSCTRKTSNKYCYTNIGSNSNINNSNAFIPTVKIMRSYIFFQALVKKVAEEQVLKSQNKHKGILKMFLMV